MKIYCIGDSHVNTFSGKDDLPFRSFDPLFKLHHLGATIAYNFYEHHYPNVLKYLQEEDFDKEKDYVMLIVGEVDQRWHILNQSKLQNRNVEDLVKECVDRFYRCYLDLKQRGYQVIVWGAMPHTLMGHCETKTSPIYGNCLDRNKVAKIWDYYMHEKGLPFISILKYVLKPDGLSDSKYFLDYCHLKSTLLLPFIYQELRQIGVLPKEISFTFGIVTSGNSDDRIEKIVESIKQLEIPQYEIIIVGNSKLNGLNVIPFDESIKSGWITKKKNIITENAKYENIVYLHDYIVFDKDWYNGWLKFGDKYHACMNVIKNQDGTRYRDWTLMPNSFPVDIGNNLLLPYYETRFQKYMYFSAAYFVAKKSVMKEFPQNNNLVWGQAEDIEWSNRYKTKYDFSMNPHSTVILLKYANPVFVEMSDDMYKYIVLPTLIDNINLIKGPEGWDTFSRFCKEIVENNIVSYKQNSKFNYMSDHLTFEQGYKYIQKHLNNEIFQKINWARIKEIDSIGDPELSINIFDNIFSASIFRYIGIAIDILSLIKNKSISIVEIGGFYGGQAKMIYELASLFGITIKKYVILDWEYCNIMQRNYLSGLENVECMKVTDYIVEPIDLVFSNYYLASIAVEYKPLFFPIIEQAEKGFFIWNTNDKIPECILNKKCYIEDENPQTGLINKCITF